MINCYIKLAQAIAEDKQMKARLSYMGKVAGLALIQSSVSAIGLLITCIVWDKWQSCQKGTGHDYVIYRTGLWDKCIDHYINRAKECSPISNLTAELKCVNVLMILSLSLQVLAVVIGLIIRRFERQQSFIFVPILFNFSAALCGTIGLTLYAVSYDKKNCHLSASYVLGCIGICEAYVSGLLFVFVAFGK